MTYEDFPEWEEYGAKGIRPKLGGGALFLEDDSWLGIYSESVDPDYELTAKSIARFSRKDADTFLALAEKWDKHIYSACLEWMFSPPVPFGQPDAMEKLLANPDSGIKPEWLFMNGAQVMEDIYESPEAQILGLRGGQSAGTSPDAYGQGLTSLMFSFVFRDVIVYPGGNHQLAHAAQRVILENGGEINHAAGVEKIIIENGKAKGLRLKDGTEIEARLGVISGASPQQLVMELTGPEYWSTQVVRRIKNLLMNWIVISWYTWALNERPKYRAEAFDPDLPYVGWLGLGKKENAVEEILKESYLRRAGQWPDPESFNLIVSDWSLHAPGNFAPPDKSCVLTEQFVLPATAYSHEEWKKIEKRHAEEILNFWQRFAPNMTWDNVIGYVPVTPHFTARHAKNYAPAGNWCVIDLESTQVGRFRPIPDLADLRNFPIENLYPCSGGWHPVGSACSHQGYWVYKILAEKYKLKKPWEAKGRVY
ncbi:MAG: NAD(P)/FAD-dependent oxidoreductase [Deltaproteobacteria bacterium]|nr:NAD(P)/FAD-dependent oxidoreductase [Deltaproteobacteria bacterium]